MWHSRSGRDRRREKKEGDEGPDEDRDGARVRDGEGGNDSMGGLVWPICIRLKQGKMSAIAAVAGVNRAVEEPRTKQLQLQSGLSREDERTQREGSVVASQSSGGELICETKSE